MREVLEICRYRRPADASAEEVRKADAAANAWLGAQAGFVSRELVASATGDVVEFVRWRSREEAERAMAALASAPELAGLAAAVDMSTFRLVYADVPEGS